MAKIACAYIRVSTSDQEEYSPDAQERLLREYAASHNISITKVYKDLGISGRIADRRPEFKEMIAECKAKEHPFDAILVWKFSRFARNQEESIVYKSLLKKNNVEVISVSEPLPDGFIGELVERIFEWMDEYYSIRLSGEVKRGMTQKALSGGYNGQPPIGYKKDKGPDTIPYIDNKYSDMVRLCFNLWTNEKKSFGDIAYTINEMGYRTRRGNKWESRNISDMIQNPFYIGKIRWNNTNNRSRELTGDTIVVDGQHEPLIETELWNQANERYNEISARQNHNKRTHLNEKHWLSGMLKCSVCGGTLAYQGGRRKDGTAYPQFVCWRSIKGMCSTRNAISVPKAEANVIESLKHLKGQDDDIHYETIQINEQQKQNQQEFIQQLKRKLERAKAAYINGVDTLAEYKETKAKIEEEIRKINDTSKPVRRKATTAQIRSVYEFIIKSDKMSERADAIREVVDHITYDKETDTMSFFL